MLGIRPWSKVAVNCCIVSKLSRFFNEFVNLVNFQLVVGFFNNHNLYTVIARWPSFTTLRASMDSTRVKLLHKQCSPKRIEICTKYVPSLFE